MLVSRRCELTPETLEGGKMLDRDYSAPFESRCITQYIERFAPADRVVLDSVPGLSAVGEDQYTFRHTPLGFIPTARRRVRRDGAVYRRGVPARPRSVVPGLLYPAGDPALAEVYPVGQVGGVGLG